MHKIFNPGEIVPGVPGIVVLSHGSLAVSLVESVRFIMGDVDNIAAFSLEEGDDPNIFCKEFAKAIELFPSETIVFVDLFGGTPYNQLIMCSRRKGVNPLAISGVNMPMLIEAIVARTSSETNGLLNASEQGGIKGIVNITRLLEENKKSL